ncbi:MAG: 50S ribosomal protein L30 [Oscillospiraceae bacterium]|jgi:large subunit ribosomal protein L30|nr:50S ribosomal protein L30 [Oscillospiraceae bacterium]
MAKLKITLVHSPIASLPKHVRTVESMGLRKLHSSVVLEDTPSVRGMIFQVKHLVSVDEIGPDAAVADGGAK